MMITKPQHAYRELPSPSQAAPSLGEFSLTPARLSDMYKGAAAAAVDTNSDGVISAEEYTDQLMHSGGSSTFAQKQFKRLDTNKDGVVTQQELADSLSAPELSLTEGVLKEALQQLNLGASAAMPSGTVLDAMGQISDPRQILRYLAHTFPGNLKQL
jgi:hypothetical protein